MMKFSAKYDSKFDQISHYFNYPELKPYVGINYESNLKKILIIGESHYFPEDEIYANIDDKFYESRNLQLDDNFNFMNTRFEATRKNLHVIHKILQRNISYDNISYFNFFQKPAINKVSIKATAKDKIEANLIFNQVVNILKPTKIIFISRLAYNHLENKNSFPENLIKQTVHPTSSWWNRKMKKYDNNSGQDLFKKFIQ